MKIATHIDSMFNQLYILLQGKSILTFVTRGQVLPSQRSQVPLVLKSNVLQEVIPPFFSFWLNLQAHKISEDVLVNS